MPSESGKILVTWEPVPELHRLGVIQGYYVEAQTTGHHLTLNVSSRSAQLQNLRKGKLYSITVAAFNMAGQGPKTPAIRVRTEDGGKSSRLNA